MAHAWKKEKKTTTAILYHKQTVHSTTAQSMIIC